ncbi:MAG: peroxiredoxin-like family protein [Acidimicrobiia bacterium]
MGRWRRTRRIEAGDVIAMEKVEAITGEHVPVPDPGRLLHLQFRRFAGCPFCNLHLQSIARRSDDIVAAGIAEVVVFHSSAASLLAHQEVELPFPIIPDPDKRLYRRFGVESSPLAVLHPRAWPAEIRGLRAKRRRFSLDLHGGPFGLPADFLIAPDGTVLARHYGSHAYDQWSADELLALARRGPVT